MSEWRDGGSCGLWGVEGEGVTEVLELADGAAAGVLGGAFAQVPRREARPPTPLMLAYIDSHKDEFGIEPISTTLQVAPLTYYAAKKRLPSARALRDAVLLPLLMTLWVAHRNQHAPSFRRVPFPARTRAAPDSFTDPQGIQRQRRLSGDLMRRLAVLIAVLGLLLGVLTASAASAVSSATVTRFTDAVKVKGVRSKVHPIRLAAGTAVKATLSWGAPHGNLDLTLRNPAGKAVASSTTRRPELVAVRVPTTGTWSLVVWARQGGSGYVLTVGQTTSSTPTPTAATPAGGSKPPAGGYFTALPPLAALPSDSE